MDANGCLKRLFATFLTLLLIAGSQVNAADTLSASPEHDRYSLNDVTRYWHTDTPLTLRDVLARTDDFQLVTSESDLHFGYTQGDTWLTTRLHNPSPRPATWLVTFEYPFLDHVTLYTLRAHFTDVQQSGSALPLSERALAHRQAIFPVTLAGDETVTLYSQVSAAGSKVLNYSVMTPEAFYAQNDRHNFWLATYFGMLLALGLYNFLLFFGLKERVFLYYSLFAFGFTLAPDAHAISLYVLGGAHHGIRHPYPTGADIDGYRRLYSCPTTTGLRTLLLMATRPQCSPIRCGMVDLFTWRSRVCTAQHEYIARQLRHAPRHSDWLRHRNVAALLCLGGTFQ